MLIKKEEIKFILFKCRHAEYHDTDDVCVISFLFFAIICHLKLQCVQERSAGGSWDCYAQFYVMLTLKKHWTLFVLTCCVGHMFMWNLTFIQFALGMSCSTDITNHFRQFSLLFFGSALTAKFKVVGKKNITVNYRLILP